MKQIEDVEKNIMLERTDIEDLEKNLKNVEEEIKKSRKICIY